MSLLSGKKLLLLGFVVVLMVIIPLTVYLVQQQQKLKVGAEKASRLFFFNQATQDNTASINKAGDSANFEVWLDPATNQVSFVKLSISYDATKLSVQSFVPDTTNFPTTLQPADKGNGKATVTLSVGSSPDNIIKTKKRVATISFNALQTATAGQTTISFDPDPATQVLSIGTSDQFNENVLLSSPPATVTIAQAAVGGTPGASLTSTASCTALNADKGTTGTAPYPVTLTAIGSATGTGTISKVTFNWGDGPAQDITTGGGIGTNSVNLPNPHTYNNPGTFVATATFTDNSGGVTPVGACTKTFTLTAASPSPAASPASGAGSGTSGGTSGTGGSTGSGGSGTTQIVTVATPTPTPVPISSPAATPAGGGGTKGGLPAPGPGDNIVRFGGLGILSIIIGALLLIGL